MDASDAEEFAEVASKPLITLPYDSPGQTFLAFEKPDGVPAVGKFLNSLRFIVKEVQILAIFECRCMFSLCEPGLSSYTVSSFNRLLLCCVISAFQVRNSGHA